MYLKGFVDIDPSHLTEIRRVPTKGFRRFAEIISGGLLSEKEEHETFTAVAILQEINVALRSLGITDVVRFTNDDQVIYDDQGGEDTDDMAVVIEKLSQERTPANREQFRTLSLLLEHHLPDITLIIEARIQRTHMVGMYPIQLIVNGLASKFNADTETSLQERLDETFADAETYATFESDLRTQFDTFMESLASAIRTKMKVTDVRQSTQLNILRPRNEESDKRSPNDAAANFDSAPSQSDPVFQRYQSDSNAFAYCWLWSHMMHSNGTHVHDAVIVDDQGQHLKTVGEEGFNAADSTLLDSSIPLSEAASGFDSSFLDSSDADTKMSTFFSGAGDDAGGGSWLDSFSSGSDSFGGDSGSSCSSCGGGD